MPSAVGGAILVLVVCFMMVSGIQIILSSQMDTPRTFVIGIALIFGMSLDVLPELYSHIYWWMRPLVESSLTLSTVLAVGVNQLLRIDWKRPRRAVNNRSRRDGTVARLALRLNTRPDRNKRTAFPSGPAAWSERLARQSEM